MSSLLTPDKNMQPLDIIYSNGEPNVDFGLEFSGLSVSSSRETLLDGNVGGFWYYSVGYSTTFQTTGTLMSPEPRVGNPGVPLPTGETLTTGILVAAKTSLYVRQQNGEFKNQP